MNAKLKLPCSDTAMTANTKFIPELIPELVHGKTLNNQFFLMRHGQSYANQRELIVSRAENALSQYGLTPKGIRQVQSALEAAGLSEQTMIISSDYARARETAELAHKGLYAESIVFDERLRERDFGDWELQDHSAYCTVWESDLLNANQQRDNVESVNSVLERALSCVADIDQRSQGRQILLVGHGDVLQILLAYFANIKPEYHRSLAGLENAEIRPLLAT